jgi:hypothetical protein
MPVVRCKHKRGKVDRVRVNLAEDTIARVLEALHTQLRLGCAVEDMVGCIDNDKLHEGAKKDLDIGSDVRTDQSATLESLGIRVSFGARRFLLFSCPFVLQSPLCQSDRRNRTTGQPGVAVYIRGTGLIGECRAKACDVPGPNSPLEATKTVAQAQAVH